MIADIFSQCCFDHMRAQELEAPSMHMYLDRLMVKCCKYTMSVLTRQSASRVVPIHAACHLNACLGHAKHRCSGSKP